MRNKLLATILVLSLFASALTIAIQVSPVAAANENVELYIDPLEVYGVECNYFNVTVMIENVTDLFGFDLNITWADNTLITFSHCYYNKTLNAIWPAGWQLILNTTGGGGGGGWYKLVALSTDTNFTKDPGSQALFKLEFHVEKSCNFELSTPIEFLVVKLSDSMWTPILAAVTNGTFYTIATVPDLEFKLVGTLPFEYCDTFKVEVWVTHICANLKDYNFTILYDHELLKFIDVEDWGTLGDNLTGQANYALIESGKIWVRDDGGDIFNSGNTSLFALKFHVEFDDANEHIWRTSGPNSLTAQVSFENATLSFDEGTIYMIGITMPSTPLDITIDLIRGDVDCDGDVDVFDLRTVAGFYDGVNAKYDVKVDGIIDIFDLVVIATNFGYGE